MWRNITKCSCFHTGDEISLNGFRSVKLIWIIRYGLRSQQLLTQLNTCRSIFQYNKWQSHHSCNGFYDIGGVQESKNKFAVKSYRSSYISLSDLSVSSLVITHSELSLRFLPNKDLINIKSTLKSCVMSAAYVTSVLILKPNHDVFSNINRVVLAPKPIP